MARRTLGPATLAVVDAIANLTVAPDPAASASAASVASSDLLVACSGGADSLALLVGTAELARRGHRISCVTVDHGLQPGSAEQAEQVARISRGLGIGCRIETVPVGTGTEAEARAARYAALDRVAREGQQVGGPDNQVRIYAESAHRRDIPAKAPHAVDSNQAPGVSSAKPATVLLGHTLDDQAETVLLGLSRGSGARSLAGMPARRTSATVEAATVEARAVEYVRPLLRLRRSDTEAVCREAGLTPWQDPMNSDPRYARVRARQAVLPVLEDQLGPGVAEALARTAEMLREDADALDDLAGVGESAKVGRFDGPELTLAELDRRPALRRRQLRAWLVGNGATEPSRRHVLAVEALVIDWHGQKHIEVPGLKVVRRAQALQVVTD